MRKRGLDGPLAQGDANTQEKNLSPELSGQLCERYPAIFEHVQSMNCGDGWFDLLDTLCASLQDVTKHGGLQVVASDVKEKYGALSFCHQGVNDEQDGMIELAEALSKRLCDVCGNRGERRSNGWIVTRCAAHAERERVAPL